MPNTREKLIELLQDSVYENVELDDGYVGYDVNYDNIANYLIANGVTIEDDHHWATEQAYKNGYEDGKPKWIPVTERLPKNPGQYLALTPNKAVDDYTTWLIWYYPENGFHDNDPEWGDIPMDDVTHWMTLPEAPKGE